jgi:cytoskeletal protein RodZ
LPETVTQNVDTSTNSPGAILKRCREYHGITLEEAAEATKIGTNYLIALENDQINAFASLAYLKGFVRIYAKFLGLNPDDILRIIEKQYVPSDAPVKDQAGLKEENGPARRRFSWQKLVLPAVLLILLLITAAILNRSQTPPRQQAPLRPATGTSQAPAVLPAISSARPAPPVPKPEAAPSPKEPAKEDTNGADHNVSSPSPPETAKGFIVKMKVTQNGTLSVTIDGAEPQNYDLTAGDVIEWKAEKNITLDLSNAGGVEAELNGKPLKAFGPAGKPASVTLDSEGVKQ